MTRILITAGGSGIGLAIAQAFARDGAQVSVIDRDAAALERCPRDWHKTTADVTDEAAMREAIQATHAAFSGIDVLCANAGIAGPTARITDIDLKDWRDCIAVNLEGAFLAAKYSAAFMTAKSSGVMLFISSTAGQHGYPNRASYAAAKWGVIGLMKTLAMELGPHGIRCNALCPGAVEGSRMSGVMAREAAAKGSTVEAIAAGYAAGTSMRTLVQPEDIAEMAVFLASPRARYVSGQVIAIDGHTENPDPKVP